MQIQDPYPQERRDRRVEGQQSILGGIFSRNLLFVACQDVDLHDSVSNLVEFS